jgi:hypothetical protein
VILSDSSWDDFFNKFNSNQIIDVVVSMDAQPLITYNWLYTDNVVIPLPIGANMTDDFYRCEYDIASVLSDDGSQFNKLMHPSQIHASEL